MPKGSSTFTSTSSGSVTATNIRLAEREVMSMAARVLEDTLRENPELSPYLNLLEFNQANIRTSGVLGFYDTVDRNIVIGDNALNLTSRQRGQLAVPTPEGVVAHEIGHALSYHSQSGHRDVERAIRIAHQQYNRGNSNRLNRSDFVGTISNYSRRNAHESFAEAFADVRVNGSNAARASQLIMRYWRQRR